MVPAAWDGMSHDGGGEMTTPTDFVTLTVAVELVLFLYGWLR